MAGDLPAWSPDVVVQINAWTGAGPGAAPMSTDRGHWATARPVLRRAATAAPPPLYEWNWQDPRLGWGLILPERDGLAPDQLARADDAPEPIRQLFADRAGARVLRYRAGKKLSDFTLRDYAGGSDPPISAPIGTGPGAIPAYLLIAASPAEVPWSVQYALNPVRRVGRLDLESDGLEHYVSALRGGWKDSQARYDSPLVWSVDRGGDDITVLMRDAIGAPLFEEFRADPDMPGARFIDGRTDTADATALIGALAAGRPAVVVTTSHGMTGPLDRPDEMRASLGGLVDSAHQILSPEDLLAHWTPDGAVWFAQACCSAGSDTPSLYRGLFDPRSLVGRVLDGVAAAGALTAPLPRALLGAPRPLRAFIGQVEPTFDWTMVFPPTRQRLTSSLRTAMYTEQCAGRPVGYALGGVYQPIGGLLLKLQNAVQSYSDNPPGPASQQSLDMALYHKVTAYDRASTVLLGDPTAAIPLPPWSPH